MTTPHPVKIRSRTGSWSTFERRFKPRTDSNGTVWIELNALPKDINPHLVWTVTDDDGRLYLNPGFRFVNRFAYVHLRGAVVRSRRTSAALSL
jgi:hypothetical protein